MGRLGLVEFRAFEMTPHARTSLAQQLLSARWSRGSGSGLTGSLVRTGALLCTTVSCFRTFCGRFFGRDSDLRQAGLPLDAGGFAASSSFVSLCWRR